MRIQLTARQELFWHCCSIRYYAAETDQRCNKGRTRGALTPE